MNKLGPGLGTLLARSRPPEPKEARPEARATAQRRGTRARKADEAPPAHAERRRTRRRRSAPERINITVKFTGALSDLEAAGFRPCTVLPHPTKGSTIATGSIATVQLAALGAIDHVVRIEGTRPLRPELDKSIIEINADTFPATEFSGSGVVVGVIEFGFDALHPVFGRAEGGTRILAIWDQSLDGDEIGGDPPAGFDIGVEFTAEEIDEAIEAADEFGVEVARSMLPIEDDDGHGTGVAAIACGNGSVANRCGDPFTYVGVAPDADLIVVLLELDEDVPGVGETQNLIDALRYIFEHPGAAGRPVVVNMSLGDNLGAHDGTSLVEQAIDTMLFQSRRAIVKSAGNEAIKRRHAHAVVEAGQTLSLEFEVMPEDDSDRHLELWYPGTGELRARVIVPVEPEFTSDQVSPGDAPEEFDVGSDDDPTTVTLEVLDTNPDNLDRSILLQLEAPADGAHLPKGPWVLELTNPTGEDIPIDAWIDRGENAPKFTDHFTRETTVSIPGTAQLVITVAAYSEATSAKGDVDRDSGRGPTRRMSADPEEPRPKPDLAAPGGAVTTARANFEKTGCSDCCISFYVPKGVNTSTSYAAPHVTGAIALMFEKNPFLSARTIKTILQDTAAPPEGDPDTPLPNFDWGAGRLDVSAALDEVEGDTPGGGEDDGGGPVPFVDRPGAHVPAGPVFARRPRPPGGTPPLAMTPTFAALRRHALGTPTGQLYAAIVSRYFSEVRALVRRNRRMAAAWRGTGGPQLIAEIARRVTAPDVPFPVGIDGRPLSASIERFLVLLRRYGSPELRLAADTYAPLMLAIPGRSLNQLLQPETARFPEEKSAA